jgi:hypothetical protein
MKTLVQAIAVNVNQNDRSLHLAFNGFTLAILISDIPDLKSVFFDDLTRIHLGFSKTALVLDNPAIHINITELLESIGEFRNLVALMSKNSADAVSMNSVW